MVKIQGFKGYVERHKVKSKDRNIKPWSLWNPRDHQKNVLDKLNKYNRVVLVWHRRAGKDLMALNHIIDRANKVKGLYWHIYPTYSQGKKALWDAMDSQGNRFIDAINGDKNTVDMSVKFTNGSKYQIIGSDVNPDSIRGANPIGVVFSEYSYMNPEIWDTIRPILSENKGWAIFLYTPNGHNHGYKMYDMACNNDDWYAEKLGVSDTNIVSEKEIKSLRDENVSEELIQQEYYCEFIEHVYGSYFSRIINLRRKEGFIGSLNIDYNLPVDTFWDIGQNTVVWFFQRQGDFICAIDYIEGNDKSLEWYLTELKAKNYLYNSHNLPHDIVNKEYSNNVSRLNTARNISRNIRLAGQVNVLARKSIKDGLYTTERFLNKCKIHYDKCVKGVEALINYKRAYNKSREIYLDEPDKHQWSSHAADAFRYAAEYYLNDFIDKSIIPDIVCNSKLINMENL